MESIKCLFDKKKKAKILNGRSITECAGIIRKQTGYITNILNGRLTCSQPLAYYLSIKLDPEALDEKEYFSELKGK